MAAELMNYINGKWQKAEASEVLEVHNPATQEVLGRVPLSKGSEVVAAAEAAQAAFPEWRQTPPEQRVQYLFALKRLLEQNLDDLSTTITMECGKTFEEARGEMTRAIENVEVACGIPILMQGVISETD